MATPQEGEWPPRDRIPLYDDARMDDVAKVDGDGGSVIVTPEMIAAGVKALPAMLGGEGWVTTCYRAMHALAPVELVPEGERQAVRERDYFKALAVQRGNLIIALRARIADHDAVSAQCVTKVYHDAIVAAKDARIAELDTLLAQRPAPVPEAPKAAQHDFTRDFSGDRRRIGG